LSRFPHSTPFRQSLSYRFSASNAGVLIARPRCRESDVFRHPRQFRSPAVTRTQPIDFVEAHNVVPVLSACAYQKGVSLVPACSIRQTCALKIALSSDVEY
jgi:hypothetical protein